jgi:hypothetical protein
MALDSLSARRRRTLTLGTLVHFSHFELSNAVDGAFYDAIKH